MFKVVFLIIAVMSLSTMALADNPRHRNTFTSPDGQYEAKLEKDRVWRLIEKSSGKELYRIKDYYRDGIWFSSMTLVIANGGSQIVAVNDYGEQNFEMNPEVVFFFRDGKLFKTHKLFDLASPRFMSFSVSHFRWLYAANKLTIVDSKISITTLDMNIFVFDTSDGTLVKKELDGIFSDGAIFVYGEVNSVDEDRYEIKVECNIRGNSKKGSRLIFTSEKIGWKASGFHEALIIQNGRLVERKGTIFNNCE